MDVKKRLNIPYRKEQSQLSKLQKLLKPQEFAAAMVNITNKEQRLEILEKQFTELETHYKSVLEKVAAAWISIEKKSDSDLHIFLCILFAGQFVCKRIIFTNLDRS